MQDAKQNTNRTNEQRIANGIHALVALALAASPWLFGFTAEAGAFWTALSIGVVGLAVAGYGAYDPRDWQAWSLAGLGVFAAVAPWIFGFAGIVDAMWSLGGFGLAHLIVAGVQLWRWRSPEPQTA
ncbi:SPW repeat domain-containing protein [Salinarimonas rosea]|uniref:SPW repeat domain-containing protein n=1 Tax=Salinarimonas rosea TaxID=552063 RepID=UPI00041784D6|nr:SPW repeat protein [Salinarimonas rosea]